MTDMINMTGTIMVLLGIARSPDTMTIPLGIGTPGSTEIERGTTRTGTGGRKGTGRETGSGSMTDMKGHPGSTMRGTGTMKGDMRDTRHLTTTRVAAGDLRPLGLHHIEDQTTKSFGQGSCEVGRAELICCNLTITI